MIKLLHIGYARTGTTTLQKHVFPKLGSYIGKHGLMEDHVRKWAHQIQSATSKITNVPDKDICSYEILLRSGDTDQRAKATKRAFPESKILITIRRQDTLLGSRYIKDLAQVVSLGYEPYKISEAVTKQNIACNFPFCKRFKDTECVCGDKKLIPLPFYDFESVRRVYAQYFDVLVLPLELLASDHQSFVNMVCDFAELERKTIDKPPITNSEPSSSFDVMDHFKPLNRIIESPANLSDFGYT